MPDIIKLGFRLFVITVVATLCLAVTNVLTEQPILDQIEATNQKAQREVLANVDDFQQIYSLDYSDPGSKSEYPRVLEVYQGLSGGEIRGYTLKVANMAYGGQMIVLVGIGPDSKIEGIRILQHSETPGLGANAQNDNFYKQYIGKAATVNINSNDISAISGATVTSNSVTDSVDAAIDFYKGKLINGGDEQ